jgi:hypothetical protein
MRADVIVVVAPGVEHTLGFGLGPENVRVETFVAQTSVEAQMDAFSTGLPGRINSSRTSWAYAHTSIARPTNSLPLSTVIAVGAPRR